MVVLVALFCGSCDLLLSAIGLDLALLFQLPFSGEVADKMDALFFAHLK
jgi:hypothetical protein